MSETKTAVKTPATSTEVPKCNCPGCLAGLTPFTVEHFRLWAGEVVLDTGEIWSLEDFQAAVVADLFAGFREIWLVVPEGNGKTTLLAGIGLYHCEHRETASVPVGASAREQAEVLFRQQEGMVLRTPRLRRVFKPQEGHRRVKGNLNTHAAGSRIQVYAADDRTGDGIIPTLPLLDELHRQRDLRLYRTWVGKLEKRNGQLLAISTAGDPGGEFEETRAMIKNTATEITTEGAFTRAISGGVVLHEWAVPEDADVEDVAIVKAANPFSGITIESLTAKRKSPTMTLAHWMRFVCNRATRDGVAAITEAEWQAAETAERMPRKQGIWLGLDVGWKWDTTALVPFLWRSPTDRLIGDAVVLVPPRDGKSLDPHSVEAALVEIHKQNPIETVVMDMSRAEQLAAWIEEEIGAKVIDRGKSNTAAVDDYERFMEALRQGWLKHTGSPVLRIHAMNAIARILPYGDARFDRPQKTRQGGNQDMRVIDALDAAAMVNAVAAMLNGQKKVSGRPVSW